MNSVQKIIQFGHPTLRQVSAEVSLDYISSSEIQDLAASLRKTLPDHGIGLAAPQINHPWRMFLADLSKSTRADESEGSSICINPKITKFSSDNETDWEGCLSAPGIWGQVTRPESIIVAFYDEFGKSQSAKLSGVAARVFQHELDHLDGILFVDRMTDMTTLVTDEEFDKIHEKVRKS